SRLASSARRGVSGPSAPSVGSQHSTGQRSVDRPRAPPWISPRRFFAQVPQDKRPLERSREMGAHRGRLALARVEMNSTVSIGGTTIRGRVCGGRRFVSRRRNRCREKRHGGVFLQWVKARPMTVSIRIARESDMTDLTSLTAQLGYEVEPSALGARLSRIL